METLQNEFKKNNILYKIIDRSPTRYFAELVNPESGSVISYETGRIICGKEGNAVIGGAEVSFKAKEFIVGNEQFGRDKFECCMSPRSKEEVRLLFEEGKRADASK